MPPRKAKPRPVEDTDSAQPARKRKSEKPPAMVNDREIMSARASAEVFEPPPEPGMPGSDRNPFECMDDEFQPAPGWETYTTATPVHHIATLDHLTALLPGLIEHQQYRRLHHTVPTQREEGNAILASLLLLEKDLLAIRHRFCLEATSRIRDERRSYPSDITGQAALLAASSDALFRRIGPEVMTRCWFDHAAVPAPGSRRHLGLGQASEAWEEQIARIKDEPVIGEFFVYDWTEEICIPALPERKPVKIEGYTKQGWPNIRFEPEMGYRSLVRLAHVKRLGRLLMQRRDR